VGIYTDLQELAKTDPDAVVSECVKLLDANPKDSLALFLMAQVYAEAEKYGIAANLFRRVADLRPEKSEAWNNLGMALEGLKIHDEAMQHFRKAWSLEKRASYASNMGNCYLSQQEYEKALEWAWKANKIDPNAGRAVIGMSSLALRDWATGWDHYESTLGGRFRKETQYQDEPRWDGTPGKTLIVYGEQGLGDEIMYASCVPDVAEQNRVVLECDRRLEGLFRRSFPQVDVYGTRREDAAWLDGYEFDARCSVGTLPKFFRRHADAFPGTPYLVADPERRIQWRALFDSWSKKPKIGIAWSGGTKHNNWQARAMGLQAFRPLMEAVDADWISLQYKDPSEEIEASGLPVRHIKRATITDDYDDTAGLVAELDLVIAVPTAVIHLSGGLGVPTLCLSPTQIGWDIQSGLPWYGSVETIWKKPNDVWEHIASVAAERVHRLRPETAHRLQRSSALDHSPRVDAGVNHPAGVVAIADQA
jgi:hypothetical protein